MKSSTNSVSMKVQTFWLMPYSKTALWHSMKRRLLAPSPRLTLRSSQNTTGLSRQRKTAALSRRPKVGSCPSWCSKASQQTTTNQSWLNLPLQPEFKLFTPLSCHRTDCATNRPWIHSVSTWPRQWRRETPRCSLSIPSLEDSVAKPQFLRETTATVL